MCRVLGTSGCHHDFGSSQEVRRQDADVHFPRQQSPRAVSPCNPDTLAVPASSTSLFVPKVDIYNGRPPILLVWLQLLDFLRDAISSEEENSDASLALSESPAHVLTSPGVRRIPRLLGLLLVTVYVVLARYQ